MNKTFALLASAALVFAAPAYAAGDDVEVKTESDIEHGDNGSYEAESETVRKDGAGKMTRETETEVDIEDDGEGERTTSTKIVNDPKGLFNKTTSETETKTKVEDGQVTTSIKKEVDGDTVEDTEIKH